MSTGHVHRYADVTRHEHGHVHQISGVTDKSADSGSRHRHTLDGHTTFISGHIHYYKTVTGPALANPEGGHSHAFTGRTTVDDGHRHGYSAKTGGPH